MSVYVITGRNGYRGHQHGQRVEMVLDMHTEARAVARGSIELIERSTPRLTEGSYRLPAADAAGRGADAHQDPDTGHRVDGT